jgi:hypothetical protein
LKRNGKLTLAISLGVISLLALSMSLAPSLNLAVKAQGQNQSSPEMSQEVQQKLGALVQKFRELVTNSGANLSLPQGGNLSEQLNTLKESAVFSNLSQQLSQLSELGINETNIKNLAEEKGSDLSGLVQKLQNLTSSRGGE